MISNEAKNLDRILVKACRLYYEEGLSKTEIADNLRISITHVNRLLKKASKKGIISITISAPRFEDLELDLINRFNLLDAKVVASSDDEDYTRMDLGAEAARYFHSKVRKGDSIGIGSGRTMYEMIKAIREEPKEVVIYPLSAITEKDTEIKSINAFTLVNTLWFKLRPSARAHKLEMFFPHKSYEETSEDVIEFKKENGIKAALERIQDLDFYFYSISPLRDNSQIMEILRDLGNGSQKLRKIGIVGDVLFNTINEAGDHIPSGIEKLTVTLETEKLKAVAANRDKHVVLAAGGQEKSDVIGASLRAGFCNVLITDDNIAKRVLMEHK